MSKPFRTTLSNGLRVVLLENHQAPVVSLNLWANVGSVNETDQEAGLCHLIEHMLFKGTGKRPVGQIAKEVEAAGGDMNAYTSFDETVFYINMSSKRMDVGLEILADAAADPTFDEEELRKEKEVVVEEISRSDDNPSQMVSLDLFSKAFSIHPYQRSIAGDRNTVRGVSREHLMAFYRRWYVGSNLLFIGVGDFKINEILPKIEALYSKIPAGHPPRQNIPSEPTQTSPRVITRGMDIEGRYLDYCFPIPDLKHADIPALDVLSQILGIGSSSRLDRIVKEEKQLVTSIGSYPYTPRHPGVFIVGAVLKDKKLQETLKATWEEILKIQETPPTTVELHRARESLRSGRVYEKQTVEAMARKLGFYEGLAGDLNFEEEYYLQLSQVTAEDIVRVANTYLKPERMTLSFCHPKNENWSREKIMDWMLKLDKTKTSTTHKKANEEIRSFKLSNGIRILLKENHNLPLISIRSASLGGIRYETLKNNGINHLISQLLTKGTNSRTARDIAEVSENLSGHIDAYTGRNMMGVSGTFLSEKISEGFDLFFDILLHPSFPEDEIRKEKEHTYAAIRHEQDSLSTVAMRKFFKGLYQKHPYGFSGLGTPATVRSLKRNQLINYYRDMVRPDNLVISIVGDVQFEDIKSRLEDKLGNWKSPKKKFPKIASIKPLKKSVEIVTNKKKIQSHIVYGFLGTTIKNRDRYTLEVLCSILSGQGGRLFLELRDKQSLCYTVSCSAQEGLEEGHIAVYMGTDSSKLETALEGIKMELAKIRTELVTEEEIERAKRFIIGNYELDMQKNNAYASLMSYHEIYGIPCQEIHRYPERIEAVTREDILRIAKKYLKSDASVLSLIKP